MTVNINAASISSARFVEQASNPATPSSGSVRLFVDNSTVYNNTLSSNTPLLKMIADDGTVTTFIGNVTTSGVGITFPPQQVASSNANTLDDYEEGTWTPTLTGGTGSAGSYSLSTTNGRYVKIGQLVYVSAGLVINDKGSWGGDVRISLPVFNASSSYSSNAPIGSVLLTRHSFTGVPIVGLGNIGASTYLVIPLVTSASAQVNLQWSQLVTTLGNFINFSYIYEV